MPCKSNVILARQSVGSGRRSNSKNFGPLVVLELKIEHVDEDKQEDKQSDKKVR